VAEGAGQDQASGASSAGPDSFISYASADAAVATALVEALERHEIACWIAPRDVKPGALYADAIVRAISAAQVFVLVLSKNSIASSHVGKEIERASSKRRPIIAVRIDTAQLTPALEYFLSESQWVDAPQGNLEAAYARLIGAIREPAKQSTAPGNMAPHLPPGSRRHRLALMAVIAVAVVVLAALLTDRLRLVRRATADKANALAASLVADKSIAVLPFADMSEKKDQEYFADGIAEEVLDRLARVPGLRVIGRTSSFRFKGNSTDSAEIGTALGAGYLLEGGVRKEAGRVRVTAQLVEAHSGAQRWSEHFDADVNDVLQVQDTIAAEIARALQIAVEVDAATRSAVTSAPALDAYLRGLQATDRSTQADAMAAVADFKQALSIDPKFAPAAIELARAYAFIGSEGWSPPRVVFEQAREAALLAERLDPKSPTPHVTMALIHTLYDW
jgi:TolB-like protein